MRRNELKGKRLLILGGTSVMKHVVVTAKEMGLYVIVDDMDSRSPAKPLADKSYDISTRDIDLLEAMARNEHIDGVFTGYEDFNTSVAVELCKRLGLCFYATEEQIKVTKKKIEFKSKCLSSGVPVVKEYADEIQYPCVVKPSDSYSAKGITIVHDRSELDAAISYALSFSKTRRYLIEKYMSPDVADCVNIDYVIRDGEIRLSAVGDKKVIRQENKAPITAAVLYPSKHQSEYIDNIDVKVKKMFADMGMRNGTVFIESFYDSDGFAVYEMGYRVGGGQSSILLNKINAVDYVEMLIRFAITGVMCDTGTFKRVTPVFEEKACGLVLMIRPGQIKKIIGLDEVEAFSSVINITQYLHVGDIVDSKYVGTLGQTFARIHVVCDTQQELNKTLTAIKETLTVLDDRENQMLLDTVGATLN